MIEPPSDGWRILTLSDPFEAITLSMVAAPGAERANTFVGLFTPGPKTWPTPSLPPKAEPQQYATLFSIAQTWPELPPEPLAVTAVTTPVPTPVLVKPATSEGLTLTGIFEFDEPPFPRRPSLPFRPQQYKMPASIAQLCLSPAAPPVTADAFVKPPPCATAAGISWLDDAPLPSRPSVPRPQQLNLPETIAQP